MHIPVHIYTNLEITVSHFQKYDDSCKCKQSVDNTSSVSSILKRNTVQITRNTQLNGTDLGVPFRETVYHDQCNKLRKVHLL